MMTCLPALPVEQVPPGTVREAIIEERSYAVCNVDGELFALSGDCPHRNGPLGHGALHGHQLLCPWHLWEFDVRTGECDMRPDCAIATYPVIVRDGVIFIQVSNARTPGS